MCSCSIIGMEERSPGEMVTIGGMVSSIDKRVTRNGGVMLQLLVEDLSGATIEAICFTKVYETHAPVLRLDAILMLEGRVERDVKDDSVKMIVMKAHEPNLGADKPLEIVLPYEAATPVLVSSLKEVLACHPGSTQVFLRLQGEKEITLRLSSEFWVDANNGLHAELKALLGPKALAGV